MHGTNGNDTIQGGVGINIINGGDGDDVLANDVVRTSNTLRPAEPATTPCAWTFWTHANTFEGGNRNPDPHRRLQRRHLSYSLNLW